MSLQWHPRALRSVQRIFGSRRGFTLVEMMVALLIFGVAVVGLVQAVPKGMSARDKARRLSVATFMAKDQVERLRSVPFSDANLAAGTHSDPLEVVQAGYRRTWAVQDNNPAPGMKRLTVRVSFHSDSPDSEVVLVTQLTR